MKILKRIFLLMICAVVLPMQTADWVSQRHLYSGNLLKSLPVDKKMYSPLAGLVGLEGEWGKKIYSEGAGDTPTDRGKLARTLFHCLDNRLRKTARPSNPFFSITPKLFGGFVKAQIEKIDVETFLESDIAKEWRALHKNKGKDSKSFKKNIKNFVELLNKIPSVERDYILAMFAMVMSEKPQDLSDYIEGLTDLEIVPQKINLLDEQLSVESADVEQFLSLLINNQSNYYQKLMPQNQLYVDYKDNRNIPICVEQSLWGFINILLYNPIKKELDLSYLPSGININSELKAFIEKYKRFNSFNYYDEAKNEFMNLVSGIKGIKYLQDGYELENSAENSLDMLNYLFGLKAETFELFGKHLSSGIRKVALKLTSEPIRDKIASLVEVAIEDSSQDYEIHTQWIFYVANHAVMRFKEDSNKLEKLQPYLKKSIDFAKDNSELSLSTLLVPLVNEVLEMDNTTFNSLGFDNKEKFLEEVLESSSLKAGTLLVPKDLLSNLSSKALKSLLLHNDAYDQALISEVVSRGDQDLLSLLASKASFELILDEAIIQGKKDIVLQLLVYGLYPAQTSISKVVKGNNLSMLMLFLDFKKIIFLRKKLGVKVAGGSVLSRELMINRIVDSALSENQAILKDLIKNKSLTLMQVLKRLDREKNKEISQFIFDYLQSSDLTKEQKEKILQVSPNLNQA